MPTRAGAKSLDRNGRMTLLSHWLCQKAIGPRRSGMEDNAVLSWVNVDPSGFVVDLDGVRRCMDGLDSRSADVQGRALG